MIIFPIQLNRQIEFFSNMLLAPHVYAALDQPWRTFMGMLGLVDGIRAGRVIAYGAVDAEGLAMGTCWGMFVGGRFHVHTAFHRHVDAVSATLEMERRCAAEHDISEFRAAIPDHNRAARLFVRRLGYADCGLTERFAWYDHDWQGHPCREWRKAV